MFMGLTWQISVAFRQRPGWAKPSAGDVISGNGGAGRDFNGKSVLLLPKGGAGARPEVKKELAVLIVRKCCLHC